MAASALLAVAPIATVTTNIATTQTVKAASEENVEKIYFTKVPTLKFKKNAEGGLQTIADWLKGVKVNEGYIESGDVGDFEANTFYKNDKHGEPIMDWQLDWSNFRNGDKGTALVYVEVKGLKPDTEYKVLVQADAPSDEYSIRKGKLEWRLMKTDNHGNLGTLDNEYGSYGYPVIKTQFVVGNKTASKISAKGYVNTRKRNSRVRTYTSTGRFSKHYVYGHHTYRLNQKKNISGLGLCYKIYGKNQWIPASKLSLR